MFGIWLYLACRLTLKVPITTKVVCFSRLLNCLRRHFHMHFYPPTKSEEYSFGVVRASVRPFRPSVHTFCLSGTISQYLLVRFNSFLVQMISTMDSRYPISLVKIDPLTLELLPLFKYRQLHNAEPILAFLCDDLHISSKLLYLTTSHYRP